MTAGVVSTQLKRCPKCKEDKPATSFYPSKRGKLGVGCYCKPCSSACSVRSQSTPEAKARIKAYNVGYRLRKYGITYSKYCELLRDQGGRCASCKCETAGGRFGQFVIDHDHETGAVRGLLCSKCNSGIGFFDDDDEKLYLAAEYIRTTKIRGGSDV